MANTLCAGIKGAEIHVPQNMIPVLNSIVHAYNKELEELRDYIHSKGTLPRRESQRAGLGRQLSPAVQMPSVYALPLDRRQRPGGTWNQRYSAGSPVLSDASGGCALCNSQARNFDGEWRKARTARTEGRRCAAIETSGPCSGQCSHG